MHILTRPHTSSPAFPSHTFPTHTHIYTPTFPTHTQVSEKQALLCYTEDALHDIKANLIRPSCHALKSEFAICWNVEDNGTPYMGEQQVGGV